jgi:hypothetical protein
MPVNSNDIEKHTRPYGKAFKRSADYQDISKIANELHLSCKYVLVGDGSPR